MDKKKRWGKKFIDKRNWPETNRRLVKRRGYLLDFGFVENWDEELAKMNEMKIGSPFMYPQRIGAGFGKNAA